MKNKEIEIKYKTTNEEFENIENYLQKNGRFVKSVTQQDTYYDNQYQSYVLDSGFIYEWLRVRLEDDKAILTYKDVSREDGGRSKIEYESEVSDPESIDSLIKALNYKVLISFVKKRKVYMYEEEFEIALDFVSKLGYFVEVEYKGNKSDEQEIFVELESIAEKIGITSETEEVLGYAHQTLIQKGLAENPFKN